MTHEINRSVITTTGQAKLDHTETAGWKQDNLDKNKVYALHNYFIGESSFTRNLYGSCSLWTDNK